MPTTSSSIETAEIVEQQRPFETRYLEMRIGGAAVSHLSLVFQTLRFGVATARCAMLSGVGTEEPYRKHGYSRHLIEHAKKVMREQGAVFALVDGISNFYHRFGYALVQPTTFLSLYHLPGEGQAGKRPGASSGNGLRPFRATDLAAVRRLYEQGTREVIGSSVRPEGGAVWNAVGAIQPHDAAKSLRVLDDEHGKVVAYSWRGFEFWKPRSIQGEGGFVLFAEAMAANQRAAGRLVDGCCGWAEEEGAPQAGPFHHTVFYVHPAGAVGQAICMRKSRVWQNYQPEGGFRAFVLDTPKLLAGLLPELQERVLAGRLTRVILLMIESDAGSAGLLCEPGGVTIVGPTQTAAHSFSIRLTPQDLAQMTFGAFGGCAVYERSCEAPHPEVAYLLDLLFPVRTPFTYPVDSY